MESALGKFTYWSLLGLRPGSDSAQLKKAFRREARRWHPDLNKNNRNAEERFKWVNEAYEVLNDPNKRLKWEVAGRPCIEIKEVRVDSQVINIPKETKVVSESSHGLDSAEKLMIILISSFILLFLDKFIL